MLIYIFGNHNTVIYKNTNYDYHSEERKHVNGNIEITSENEHS